MYTVAQRFNYIQLFHCVVSPALYVCIYVYVCMCVMCVCALCVHVCYVKQAHMLEGEYSLSARKQEMSMCYVLFTE